MSVKAHIDSLLVESGYYKWFYKSSKLISLFGLIAQIWLLLLWIITKRETLAQTDQSSFSNVNSIPFYKNHSDIISEQPLEFLRLKTTHH